MAVTAHTMGLFSSCLLLYLAFVISSYSTHTLNPMKPSDQRLTFQLVQTVKSFAQEYRAFRKEAARVITDTVIPSDSDDALNSVVERAIDLQTRLFESYGVKAGEEKGKFGVRYLMIPTQRVTGNLLTERTFILAPSPFDKVTIVVKKTDGKAGADITACARYLQNNTRYDEKYKSFAIGEDSTEDSVMFVFTGAADKVITLHLLQTGRVINRFEYAITIEGELDHAAMRAIHASQQRKALV